MSRYNADIIIVGAGLIGSTLALALAKKASGDKPLKIVVVERAPQLTRNEMPNQRIIALGRVATSLLDDIGVLESLGSDFCHPYEQMFVWDESSQGELSFNSAEYDLPLLGHMIDSVQCSLLLQQKMNQVDSIETYYESAADAPIFNDDGSGVQLQLSDVRLNAPLIIAADGASSWLRTQAKIFANHRSYNQHGIVAKIETKYSHEDTAWQRFLSTGPLAVLPVKNNQSSIVWSVDNDKSAELMALSKSEFEARLAQALGNKLGSVTLLTKRIAFPLISQQASSYFVRNVALVGDAAHSIHPLAGQGANLGFKDIQSLVSLLLEAHEGKARAFSDVRLLQRYQTQRKADNQQTDFMMSALHHAYQGRMPAWLVARGFGMNAIDRLSFIKKILVTQALG